jgi:hypothetical protein
MATIGNYRRHVMELREVIKANCENTKELIRQSNKLEKAIESFEDERKIDMELVIKVENVKNDLMVVAKKSVAQHLKLFEAYDRLIDDLLKE